MSTTAPTPQELHAIIAFLDNPYCPLAKSALCTIPYIKERHEGIGVTIGRILLSHIRAVHANLTERTQCTLVVTGHDYTDAHNVGAHEAFQEAAALLLPEPLDSTQGGAKP